MQVEDWRGAFGVHTTPYQLLRKLPAGLMLDVGASVGMTTTEILANSPGSRVLAYEPFPGNWPHFERVHGGDDRVSLVKAAVSDSGGKMRFHVPRLIAATDGQWADYAGGSSGGHLTDDGEFEVQTRKLDGDLGPDGRAVFLKIDVQGGEPGVLRGVQQALKDQRIDLLLVEYSGLPELFEFMERVGYRCWDTEYALSLRGRCDLSNWAVHAKRLASTGRTRLKAFPKAAPRSAADWAEFVQTESDRIGGVWTDLMFASPKAQERLCP